MASQSPPDNPPRTAVLVVHGMGSQRPLETVRGVIDAVWRDDDSIRSPDKKLWVHPEASGIDLDLSVFTTEARPETNNRNVDFHELYWAHLLSETRAVAVLLWLFELARKGPHLNPRLRFVWWGGAVFLAFLLLSVSLLTLQLIQWTSQIADKSEALLLAPLLVIGVAVLAILAISLWERTYKFAFWLFWPVLALVMLVAIATVLAHWGWWPPNVTPADAITWSRTVSTHFLPLLVAALAARILMRRKDGKGLGGLAPLVFAYALSWVFSGVCALIFARGSWAALSTVPVAGLIPWSLASNWSAVAAWLFLAVYLVLNAAFLQPYLGDAARYFRDSPANVQGRREIRREAVKMLEGLHTSRLYDRIIVVAHSLGTVVAYDMLRVYYGRICRDFLAPSALAPAFAGVNAGRGGMAERRSAGRKLIERMVAIASLTAKQSAQGGKSPAPGQQKFTPWMVTDFVTLGSPLTHAEYLMCNGGTREELRDDFARRTKEREFPTCPPMRLDNDELLVYTPPALPPRFHHGGMFAMTRWTNLYFPMYELVWGDAIGGPVANLFGNADRQVAKDVAVFTENEKVHDFFAHVLYWDVHRPNERRAPHILALRDAINLADK